MHCPWYDMQPHALIYYHTLADGFCLSFCLSLCLSLSVSLSLCMCLYLWLSVCLSASLSLSLSLISCCFRFAWSIYSSHHSFIAGLPVTTWRTLWLEVVKLRFSVNIRSLKQLLSACSPSCCASYTAREYPYPSYVASALKPAQVSWKDVVLQNLSFPTIFRICFVHHFEQLGTNIDIFNSYWFVIVTFSTVGYGDISPGHWTSKLVVTIFIGAALVYLPPKVRWQSLPCQ